MLVFLVLMTAIWSFLVFDYVFLLTQGGPAGASEVLGTLIYKNAFNRFDAGYAAAQGLMLSAFAGVLVGGFVLLRRRGWDIYIARRARGAKPASRRTTSC
jgi:raffinose/stachyose/melibiose transport system permease protein